MISGWLWHTLLCLCFRGILQPAAFENDGKHDWPKFWVRVENELELTEKQAHELLEMESLKESIDKGWSLEDIWNELVKRLRDQESVEPPEIIEEEPELLFDDPEVESPIDMTWLKESLEDLQWADVGKWLREKYKAYGATVKAMVESLTREQQEEFCEEVKRRLGAKG